ncbi:hypothetical protein RN001_006152 [Aquatica leii]|uniref:Uncharacterized protein n=1 Tax=Aquatica leii TaxID=1421715 RepID=A0AAN7PDP8_9COLE|nr:hypothetical protein RN001_006152 [Aquatica leii]
MSVIASTSDCLKIHNWLNGSIIQHYTPENISSNSSIKSISWSRDGRWMLLTPSTGASKLLGVGKNLKVIQTLEDIYYPTYAVFQHTTKRNVAIGTVSGAILIYDIKQRTVKKRFPRAPSSIFSFKWNCKDSHIAAACINGDIILYNNISLNISSSYKIPQTKTVSAINFHNCRRNLLCAGSEEGIVAVWDINTNHVLYNLKAHQATVTDLTFSPIRSDVLVSSGLDRRLQFYDILSRQCITEIELINSATAIDFSPCGTYLGVGSQIGNIMLYDTRSFKKPISAFVGHAHKKIGHLFFQTVLGGFDSENFSITISEDESEKTQNLEYKKKVDSLGLISYDSFENKIINNSKKGNEDSFLTALGLETSAHISEISIRLDNFRNVTSEEDQQYTDIEKNVLLQNTVSSQKPLLKEVSSTPKHLLEKLPSITESPIITSSGNVANFSLEEVTHTVRQVVRNELETELEKLKFDIKSDLLQAIHDVRLGILNIQMANIQQSLSTETKLNSMYKMLKRIEIFQDEGDGNKNFKF